MGKKIRLGISRCLMGDNVRYDGGHKHDPYITQTLGQFFDFEPVCPEVECGLPVPREAMRLEGDPSKPRLVTIRTRVDHSDRMQRWSNSRIKELARADLAGFIFKKDSPSSGMERVKVYDAKGIPHRLGEGLFASAFKRSFPLLPVIDEGRLHDPGLRENFIEQVFAFERWREWMESHPSRGSLVDFHTRHKLLLLAHSPALYREMGKIVAQAKGQPWPQVMQKYQTLFFSALRQRATVKKHLNVLMHMMGYFKKVLSADEKQELMSVLDQYANAYVPLIVPLTLMKHYIRKIDQPYLKDQWYIEPHPIELALRNHV